MTIIYVERCGGLAGIGCTCSCIRSQGKINTSALSSAEIEQIERLFNQKNVLKQTKTRSDQFKYQLIRQSPNGQIDKVEVQETELPSKVISCIKDELI